MHRSSSKPKTVLDSFVHTQLDIAELEEECKDCNKSESKIQLVSNKENSLARAPDAKRTKAKSHFIPRKFIDLKRWHCIPPPHTSKASGVTGVVGCWNYLFSCLGHGTFPALAAEEALSILGSVQDAGKASFGQSASDGVVVKWFESLCEHFGVGCKVGLFIREDEKISNNTLKNFFTDIKNEKKAFICHCGGRFLVPIGYDAVPSDPMKGYADEVDLGSSEPWVLVGDTAKKQPGMGIVRWREVMRQSAYMSNYKEKYRPVKLKKDKPKCTPSFIVFEVA